MKKILLLFFSAILSFLALSYVDEYENLMAPLFSSDKDADVELFEPGKDEGRIGDFLVNFNSMLSTAYLSSDPSKVTALPLSDELKRDITGEIVFLGRRSRTMDMLLKELTVIKIKRLSQTAIQVKVRERVATRYLIGDDDSSSGAYLESEKLVTYLLTVGLNGFTISSFEITSMRDIG